MKWFLPFLLALLAAGCTSRPSAPDLGHVSLEASDGGRAALRHVRLEGSPAAAVLTGQVRRTPGYSAARPLHLDIVLHDTAGVARRQLVADFHPQPIPRTGPLANGRAHFTVALGPLDPTTARVAVRLHSGDHADDS